MEKLLLYTDGGARSNPGPAAAGFVIKTEAGQIFKEGGRFLGKATNNEAEYQALIDGLKAAKEFAPDHLDCFLDSSLVVNQLKGVFKVKQHHLQELVFKIKTLEQSLKSVRYQYIPREKNKEADAWVNKVLDEQASNPQNITLR